MEKPLAENRAGGKTKGLSIVLEGVDSKLITELSVAVAGIISESGRKVILDNELRNPEENVLIANQYLLDVTAAPLSPETVSLMVVIKLRKRQAKVRDAKNEGTYTVSNSSWLSDAYYYELRSKSEVSKQIIQDCDFMKPDVWLVIDEESGVYSRLAKQVGVKVLPSSLAKTKIVSQIDAMIKLAEQNLSSQATEKSQPAEEIPPNKPRASYLAITRSFFNAPPQVSNVELRTTLEYYRPEKLGKKVLGAYDTILKKILQNYTQAVTDYSKHLATQAIRNKKPFKVEKLMTEARQLCRSLLPACILIDTEETQEFEELLEPSDGLNSKISGLLPNIDSDPPNLQVNLVSHAPRNEFEVLESIIFANSDQSPASIKRLVEELSYEKKAKLLKDSLNQVTSLQNMTYGFDISCEFRQLFDLLNGIGGNLTMQDLTPRNGYDIPEKIENAGLADLYQQSFDLSLELYSLLQAAGFNSQAQYAVLLGHRVRCKLTLGYEQVAKLHSSKNEGFKMLAKDIKQQVSGVHSLMWSLW